MSPDEIMKALAKPFPADRVHWRVGSTTKDKAKGMALAYLDSRDVQDRLDEVCGHLWQCKHEWSSGTRLQCAIGVKLGDEWVWRSDGAGDTQVEAEKGAFSGAFKRAAVQWGIGRYLYSAPSPWMPLNQYKAFSDETQKQLTEQLKRWQAGREPKPPYPDGRFVENLPKWRLAIADGKATADTVIFRAEQTGTLTDAQKRQIRGE